MEIVKYAVIFGIGLGEGAILCDWQHLKKSQLKATGKKK